MSNKDKGIVSTLDSLHGVLKNQGAHQGTVLNVGYGNFILSSRIIAILESGSLPMKRLREAAAAANHLIDATAGRKMRSLIVTDSKHIVLSALAPQTLQERLLSKHTVRSPSQLEWEEGEFVS